MFNSALKNKVKIMENELHLLRKELGDLRHNTEIYIPVYDEKGIRCKRFTNSWTIPYEINDSERIRLQDIINLLDPWNRLRKIKRNASEGLVYISKKELNKSDDLQ